MIRLVVIATFIAIAGCASVGREIDLAAVEKLESGISTIDDAVALLGPYTSQSVNSKGVRSYGWSYAKSNGFTGRMESSAVMLVFGPDGKLERKGQSQNNGSF